MQAGRHGDDARQRQKFDRSKGNDTNKEEHKRHGNGAEQHKHKKNKCKGRKIGSKDQGEKCRRTCSTAKAKSLYGGRVLIKRMIYEENQDIREQFGG